MDRLIIMRLLLVFIYFHFLSCIILYFIECIHHFLIQLEFFIINGSCMSNKYESVSYINKSTDKSTNIITNRFQCLKG